ncbi:ATP-binding cassette domain-containing protein [Synechococcales cyanobacterium C]|uniref:ATP-binding cassette domain-containing protein n=1 Tax=Petrachloros mirabilis ULC683 TaxID=2781853 RepID=A0A8K1ZZN9_9CYAN|nr:ABC transporter ATP-binding protein [Petrachloros mirabilis]NCJ07066.1 ATP-binding cassette domain-containing protein [Petrachloros mirabilis ULC683]
MRQKKHSLLADLRQLWGHLKQRRQRQLGMLLLLLIISALAEMVTVGAIFPFLSALGNAPAMLQNQQLQPVFAALGIATTHRLVLVMALGFVAALGVANGLRLLALHARYKLAAAIAADVSSRVYYTTLYQPYSFHVRQNSSDLIQTVTLDTDQLTNDILIQFVDFLANSLLAPALIITLMLINWRLAIGAALILGTVYTVIFWMRQGLLKRNSALFSQAGQHKVKVVQEGIGGIREVLLDHSQSFFHHAYQRDEQRLRRVQITNRIISQSPVFLIEFITLGSISLLALSLGRDGDFSEAVPVLGSLALGAKRLVPALQRSFFSLATIQGARASLLRVLAALNRPVDSLLLLEPEFAPLNLSQELQLAGVWFRYGDDSPWILWDLNLTIAAKTTVAFAGSTGSGKSTTADLILGLLQPEKGQILVDGVPLEGTRLRQWQAAVAHVPQQIYLSDSTLAENIAFGIPEKEINFNQVRRAAKLAQIDEFIEGLSGGYDTYVGERGIRLSGGQRQRIGIARALYKNASVIVFDEATSALDNTTEREVMESINNLSHQLTIILIAHRLSTVEKCDRIFELDQGRIIYSGTFEELLTHSPTFRNHAAMQGFLA